MKDLFKKINILIIISFLIMFFLFHLNVHAEDNIVECSFNLFYEYSGEEIKLNKLSLTVNGQTLVQEDDYTIEYISDDYINNGEKNVTITLIDSYSEYYFEDGSKEKTISYYIVDKVIDLSDYNIYDGMSVERVNGVASLDFYFEPLINQYGDYLTVTNATTTESTGIAFVELNNNFDTVVNYKDSYENNYYKRTSESASNILNINFNAFDYLIKEDDERLEITGLDNIAYELNSMYEFSWNGSVYFEEKELEYGTDYDADLYSNELGDSEDEYRVSLLDETKADGSLYDLELIIKFNGSYGGTVTKIIKLAPSIDNAEIIPLDGAEIETDASGSRIVFQYGLKQLPFNLKLDLNGEEKILTYGNDFTCDDYAFTALAGSQLILNVKGIGNYAGTFQTNYLLTPKSLLSEDISYISEENAYYNEETSQAELGIKIYDNSISTENTIDRGNYQINYAYDLENKKAIATISGVNCYKDSFTVEFDLALVSWGDENLNCSIDWDAVGVDTLPGMLYTGSTIKPTINLTYNDTQLIEGTDYDVDIEGGLNVGDSSNVHIVFKGNYYGEVSYTFNVLAISSSDLTITKDDYVIYDGNPATLDFVIKDINDNTLVLNQDFEVRYENNNTYGEASYTIIFKGNYSGTSEGSFYVAQYAVDLGSYGIDFENTYSAVIKDGKASIKDKFQDLLNDYGDYITVTNLEVETEDYQRVTSYFSYNDNIFPYFVYVNDDNIEEISHFGNDFEFVWDAALANITLDDPLFEMSKITNSSYYIGSHESISGNPSMEYNGEELVSDDYEVTTVIKDKDGFIHYYDNDLKTSGISNEDADGSVYTAYVNIIFKGRYCGEINYTFSICPSIENFMIVPNDDARLDGNTLYYDFNGKVIVPDFHLETEINGEIKTLTLGEDFIISHINGLSDAEFSQKDASDSSIEILVEGINNYAGSAYVYYKIEKRGLDDLRFNLSNNCFVDDNQNVLYELEIYDEAIDYYLTSDDYTLRYTIESDKVNFMIIGGINYDGEVTKSLNKASNLIKEENISVKYDSPEGNIMYYTGEKVEPKITIIVGDYELVKDTDYKITYKGDFAEFGSTILYTIDGLADYYGRFSDEFVLEGISNIIEEVALEIISSATESVDIDLNEINFEDLTGLSKEELIKAKEFYINLEKYVVDNKIDLLVNNHLKDLGSELEFSVSEIALMLKDYLDEYAINVGYSNFNSQVDDAINAISVEEEKETIKEELSAYIHRHNKVTTIEKLHQVVSDKNDELDSIYYEQCLSDESRSGYFEELTNKVHEIKDVTIIIVKHTQSQAIANNNIEEYYEELTKSGKYNEEQLSLLKEVFDEMQKKVENVLSGTSIDDQIKIQEKLNQIVAEAIEKLSNVEITNIKTNEDADVQASVSSTSGMESNTFLTVEKALTNVSIAISKAIKSNNVYGEDDGILLIKNKDVKEAFDINLNASGEKITNFEGEYTVKILLNDKLKSFNNLQVIYIASDGSVEVLDTTVEGDYLIFVTTHFSTYYLLGDKLVDFAPIIKILIAVNVALIILIVYLVLKIKKKKINEIGLMLSCFLVPLSSIISINVLIVCIILGIIALILVAVAVLLAIKDYKIDRGLQDEK